jgi:hypothetical protein
MLLRVPLKLRLAACAVAVLARTAATITSARCLQLLQDMVIPSIQGAPPWSHPGKMLAMAMILHNDGTPTNRRFSSDDWGKMVRCLIPMRRRDNQ